MNKVETFKTVFLTDLLTNESQFTKNINIEFDVDEVRLKYISIYNNVPDGANIMTLRCDLVANNVLFSFPETQTISESLDIPFRLATNRISRDFVFRITDVDGYDVNVTTLHISLCLIFIKYQK